MSGGPLSPARPAVLIVPRASERACAIEEVVLRVVRWSCQGSGSQSQRGLHKGAEPLDVTSGRRYPLAEHVVAVRCFTIAPLILSLIEQRCTGVDDETIVVQRTSTSFMACTLIYDPVLLCG